MATIAKSAPAEIRGGAGIAFLRRVWKLLWPASEETSPEDRSGLEDLSFIGRVRKFLWLSSGLFSAASLAIPAIGFLAFRSGADTSTNFVAAVVSACLFGLASLLHFGPEEA